MRGSRVVGVSLRTKCTVLGSSQVLHWGRWKWCASSLVLTVSSAEDNGWIFMTGRIVVATKLTVKPVWTLPHVLINLSLVCWCVAVWACSQDLSQAAQLVCTLDVLSLVDNSFKSLFVKCASKTLLRIMLIVKVWVEVNLIAEYGILGGWCVVELGMIITLMTQCVQQVLLRIVPKSSLLLSTASLNWVGICLLEHFLFIHGRVRWWLHMHCSLLGRMFEVNWLLLLTWVEVARALLKYSFFWLLDRFARHVNRSLVLQLQWHGLVFVCLNRWSHIVLLIIALIDRWERPVFTSHVHI